jgi:hypothetical protein
VLRPSVSPVGFAGLLAVISFRLEAPPRPTELLFEQPLKVCCRGGSEGYREAPTYQQNSLGQSHGDGVGSRSTQAGAHPTLLRIAVLTPTS